MVIDGVDERGARAQLRFIESPRVFTYTVAATLSNLTILIDVSGLGTLRFK